MRGLFHCISSSLSVFTREGFPQFMSSLFLARFLEHFFPFEEGLTFPVIFFYTRTNDLL